MLPYVKMAYRNTPVRHLGLSAYQLRHAGGFMHLPIDRMMLKRFDEEHPNPHEYIKNMRYHIEMLGT